MSAVLVRGVGRIFRVRLGLGSSQAAIRLRAQKVLKVVRTPQTLKPKPLGQGTAILQVN